MILKLTLDSRKYTESVIQLVELAQGDTGGSRVAAQVLLSAYDGRKFQLDVSDLSNLDTHYYECAMNVIHGRRDLSKEPHSCIQDGNLIFSELIEEWSSLALEERFKSVCFKCNGHKFDFDDEQEPIKDEKCRVCSGTGKTLPEGLMYEE